MATPATDNLALVTCSIYNPTLLVIELQLWVGIGRQTETAIPQMHEPRIFTTASLSVICRGVLVCVFETMLIMQCYSYHTKCI